jgi:hypothetical protein
VPELFFHDGLEAIEHRGLAVLEHLDFSREVRSVDRGQVRAKLRGTVGAQGERFSERRLGATGLSAAERWLRVTDLLGLFLGRLAVAHGEDRGE